MISDFHQSSFKSQEALRPDRLTAAAPMIEKVHNLLMAHNEKPVRMNRTGQSA
ncbi:hypothetical protein [Phreatobacter sp.]|uniref:hypothetical protein n=1 Tax=Phreatobacter sp. TaxID=1966341 RepID=UPI003F6F4B43